jgi:hypothetical protein
MVWKGYGQFVSHVLYWQNIIWQWCSAIFMIVGHELYCFFNLLGFISVVPFVMVRSSKMYILKVYSLCSIFCLLACWSGVSLCFFLFHLFSIMVHVVWNGVSKLAICTLFLISSAIVLVVDEYRQAILMGVSVVDPPCFATMCFVRPLYIIPRRPWLLSASLSCSTSRKTGLLRTVKLRVPKKVVRPRISANVSVSNKSIV